MTGQFAAEPSDASATLLYDVAGDAWDVKVARSLGLDPDLLAPLLPHSGTQAGSLLAGPAEALGLQAGTPWRLARETPQPQRSGPG